EPRRASSALSLHTLSHREQGWTDLPWMSHGCMSVPRSRRGETTMLRYPGIILLVLCSTVPAPARSSADALFEEHAKDFGVVARGPTLTYPFRLTNNTERPVHIGNVRVSCGCVTARALQYDVAPGQSAVIQADMDTRRFQGAKRVIVYVQVDQPQWE